MTKSVLEKPPILLVDQHALDFSKEELPDMMVKLNALFPNSTIIMCLSTFEDIIEFEECIVMDSGLVLEHGTVKSLILNKSSNLNHLIINSDPQDFIDLFEKAGGKTPQPTNMERLHQEENELYEEQQRLIEQEAKLEEQELAFEAKQKAMEEERKQYEEQKKAELEQCFMNSKTDLPTMQGYEYTKMDLGKKVNQIVKNSQPKETIARSERSCSKPNSNINSQRDNSNPQLPDTSQKPPKIKSITSPKNIPYIPRPEKTPGDLNINIDTVRAGTPTQKDTLSWNFSPSSGLHR